MTLDSLAFQVNELKDRINRIENTQTGIDSDFLDIKMSIDDTIRDLNDTVDSYSGAISDLSKSIGVVSVYARSMSARTDALETIVQEQENLLSNLTISSSTLNTIIANLNTTVENSTNDISRLNEKITVAETMQGLNGDAINVIKTAIDGITFDIENLSGITTSNVDFNDLKTRFEAWVDNYRDLRTEILGGFSALTESVKSLSNSVSTNGISIARLERNDATQDKINQSIASALGLKDIEGLLTTYPSN